MEARRPARLAEGLPALWLAGEKGRDPYIWAVIGVLFGPIAVAMVGFAPRRAGGIFGECPACREAIRAEARICPFCRTRFVGEEA